MFGFFCRSVSLMLMGVALTTSAWPKDFTEVEEKAIGDVAAYLTGLSTIKADFVQIAPDGSLTSGIFYLQRPGKMLWQYNPPTPIQMIANGEYLIFYDYELEQTSHIPLEDTLAGFLARDVIEFGDDVVITDVEQGEGSLRLSMIQFAKPDDGKLTLEFATGPLQLRNMVIKDAVGQETTVALNNARYGMELDDKLFILVDPRTKPSIGKPDRGIKR